MVIHQPTMPGQLAVISAMNNSPLEHWVSCRVMGSTQQCSKIQSEVPVRRAKMGELSVYKQGHIKLQTKAWMLYCTGCICCCIDPPCAW